MKTFLALFKDKGAIEFLSLLDEILGASSHTVFYYKNTTFEKLEEAQKDDLEHVGEVFVSLWFLLKCLDFITTFTNFVTPLDCI